MRRLVALAILIALLAWGVYVWMWAKGKLAEDAQKAAAKAKSQAQVYMPKDCQLKNLEIRVSPEQTVYQVGSEVGLQMSVKNTGETPCIADGSFAKVGVHIKSGDQDTYFSLPCNKDLPKKTLLLDKNQTWQKTLAWDGSTADKKCAATGSAQAGTYKLIPVFGNKEFPGEQSIVTFEGAPAPQSQETPQGQ